MYNKMDRRSLKLMALKQPLNRKKILNKGPLFAFFWAIMIFTVFFYLLLIFSLISYSDWETLAGVFRDPEFYFAIKFTFQTSTLAITLATIVALLCGFLLSRYRFKGRAFFDTLFDIPIILPPLVSGIALLIFFGPFLGDQLARLGINVVFSPWGVVIAQWFIATPFATKTFKHTFASLDRRMEKVARTLGFTPAMVFYKVTLPLARNGIIGGIIMAWARALGEFGATAMLAGITRMKTETLSVAVFLNMSIGDMKFALSTALVMLLIALFLLVTVKVFLSDEVRT